MSRLLFPQEKKHPSIRHLQGHSDIVEEVLAAVEREEIVVVGMSQNPYCKKARKHLEERKTSFTYLEYGSYLKQWNRRLSLKMWLGWPTFPMVFVRGQFIGGYDNLLSLEKSGELQEILAS